MIIVIVTSHVRAEKVDDFLRAGRALREVVLAEPGCLGYDHFVDWQSPLKSQQPVDATRVMLIERWKSPADLADHAEVPHGKLFAEQVRAWRTSVTVEVLRSAY